MQTEQEKIDIQTEALMRLAQQLIADKDSSAVATQLIAENLEELTLFTERLEDKINIMIEGYKAQMDNWNTDTCIKTRNFLQTIEEIGLIKFFKFLKITVNTLIITLVGTALVYIIKALYLGVTFLHKLAP